MRIVVALQDLDPPTGTVSWRGRPQRFVGWLDLVSVLRGALDSDSGTSDSRGEGLASAEGRSTAGPVRAVDDQPPLRTKDRT